jgi:hypothetical protein
MTRKLSCSRCLMQLTETKYPQCRKVFTEKHLNFALINLLQDYANLKAESLKKREQILN